MAELDFVTAPHSIPGEEEQYGWWFSKVTFIENMQSFIYQGGALPRKGGVLTMPIFLGRFDIVYRDQPKDF